MQNKKNRYTYITVLFFLYYHATENKNTLLRSAKIVGWLTLLGVLFIIGLMIFNRMLNSNSLREQGLISCTITWKESTITNCDKRIETWNSSGNQVSFIAWAYTTLYIPFTQNKIVLTISGLDKWSYEFFLIVDHFWWKEYRELYDSIIVDRSPKTLAPSLSGQNTFLFE